MDGRRGFLDRLAEGIDLPGEALPGQPVLEVAGDRRVLIEHHRGVTEYSRERIGVRVSYGQIMICGCGLELVRMCKEQLVVTGQIDGITFCRR